jgi:hypothetical protein
MCSSRNKDRWARFEAFWQRSKGGQWAERARWEQAGAGGKHGKQPEGAGGASAAGEQGSGDF